MKIAVTANGDSPQAVLEPRFGRALNFLVFDTESGEFTVIDNLQQLDAAQGAGIQAAMTVINAGVQAVITRHCGPKAFRMLRTGGVVIYLTDAATVAEALERFRRGELAVAADADVEGHWA